MLTINKRVVWMAESYDIFFETSEFGGVFLGHGLSGVYKRGVLPGKFLVFSLISRNLFPAYKHRKYPYNVGERTPNYGW